MKTFRNFIEEDLGLEMPHDSIPGSWFSENGLMTVSVIAADARERINSSLTI